MTMVPCVAALAQDVTAPRSSLLPPITPAPLHVATSLTDIFGTPTPPPQGSPGPMPTPSGAGGKVTYTLDRDPHADPQAAAMYGRITAAMDQAIWYYNNYTIGLRGDRRVMYTPGVPTADASFNGPVRFGGMCNTRVAMHELMHTFGIGTTWQWEKLVKDNIFTGRHATRELRMITGDPTAQVHADRMHFWPYGLNYDQEVHSERDLIAHCLMVEAITKDLREVR
jgi:hypothetical protein